MVTALIASVISVALIFGALFLLKRQIVSSVGSERESISAKIPALSVELEALLKNSKDFVSKAQIDSVLLQVATAQEELNKEKKSLQEIESKLDEAQKLVEEKETVHQELKSSKEEDEIRLRELTERYDNISSESIGLEQRLASSMKNLDLLMAEVQLTADQKAVLQDLANALSGAGERLRDLLTEYSTVHERLEMLQQQHQDLEAEYTRLVEQQLGE